MRIVTLAAAALLTLPLLAQNDSTSRWRIGVGVGAGSLEYEEEGVDNLSEDAGAFRLGFEGTSRRGFGGGLRVDSYAAEDYEVEVFPGSFATFDLSIGSVYGHFTYRVQEQRFAMPVRFGVLANSASIESVNELTANTVGVLAEIEPEVTLVGSPNAQWTIYGELSLGRGVTVVELDSNGEQWDSSTTFVGFGIGTRAYLGICELSLAYVVRDQSMDRTDPGDINGFELTGYDASFNGVMFGVAVVF